MDVYSPAVSGGPVTVYESGVVNRRLMPGFPAVPRRTDIYTGQDSVASVGTWKMKVSNPDGLFSPDGLFAPDLRDVLCAATVSGRIVFVGRAYKLTYEQNGLVANVHWRDFLDDFLTQQVEGVDADTIADVPRLGQDVTLVAQAWLIGVMREFGFPAYRRADGVTNVPAVDVPLWYPEETTTLRQWLLPVFAALGLSFDWQGVVSGNTLTPSLRASWEGEFLNRAGIPVFTDDHLMGKVVWDDGREQVANLWSGKRRYFDFAAGEFKRQDLEARVSFARGSTAGVSRERFGERKSRMRFDQLRVSEDEMLARVNGMLERRLWEHPRARIQLRGPDAAGLRVGDGFCTHFGLGVGSGRGLNRYWRVIGRTLVVREEARDASTEVYAEMRDGRDEDYRDWYGAAGRVQRAAAV